MSQNARPQDEDGRIEVRLRINGDAYDVLERPDATLLDVLNRSLGMTATREGCGVGMCGACTVLIDGDPMSACLLLVFQAEGKEILTLEGLSTSGSVLHPVQQAFADRTGFQCSYCTPGFILATKAMLEERPDIDQEDAAEYLAGNLCRCGSYVKILDAVMKACQRSRDD